MHFSLANFDDDPEQQEKQVGRIFCRCMNEHKVAFLSALVAFLSWIFPILHPINRTFTWALTGVEAVRTFQTR